MHRRRIIFLLASLTMMGALGSAMASGCALVAGVDDVFLVPNEASTSAEADALAPPIDSDPGFDTRFLADLSPDNTITILDTGEDDTRTPPVDTKPKGCPAGRGPVMAKIDVAGGNPYCIDTSEVTNAQLNVFLTDGALPYDTHPACASFKSTTRPVPKSEPVALDKPANSINYCYALAFCHWAGKRLCGKIGGGHASSNGDDSKNEWFHACSNGLSVSNYPYGAVFDETACNIKLSDAGGSVASNLVEAKSKALCHGMSGGHALVFDMSGNIAEFDDYASDYTAGTGSSTSVHVHGGYIGAPDPPADGRCRNQEAFGIGTVFSSSGFRCCADFEP